jgi:hypothetical protein
MRWIACAAGLFAAALLAFPPIATAENVECHGGFVFGPADNVVIAENANCTVFAAEVRGNIKALPGSQLVVLNSDIRGNIEADSPRRIGIQSTTVGGNIAVVGATGPGSPFGTLTLTVFVCNTTMPDGNIRVEKSGGGTIAVGSQLEVCAGNQLGKGNIEVVENSIPPNEGLGVLRNSAGGNVRVLENRGPGGKLVQENQVRQDLTCRRNDPPFVGGPNAAANAEGQCF